MNEHVVRVLEFDKILERLAQRTSFSASRQLAVSLRPSPELSTVKSRLALTTEGRWLADDRPDMRVAGASDVRPLVERAALGAILEPSDLLDIDSTIVGASRLRSGLPKTFAATPMLSERAGALPALDRLGQEITRCLNDRGELRDSASSLIGRLRADIRVAHRRRPRSSRSSHAVRNQGGIRSGPHHHAKVRSVRPVRQGGTPAARTRSGTRSIR